MSDRLALVTGYPGWLGSRLVRFLREPHPDRPPGVDAGFDRVRCLVLPGTLENGADPDIEIVEGDLRDPDAAGRLCADAEGATLFHVAGIIHPQRRVRELFEVNVEGTRQAIGAAERAGVRRIVATSSNSPVGAARDPATLFDESSPRRPYLAYGRSKAQMEDELSAAHARGRVETVIVRPTWFYGPGQPPRQTTFFTMVKEGKAPIVGGGTGRRSMTYVDSAALGLILAATRDDAAGETYWIANERPYTMTEIVDTIEDLLEHEFGIEVAHKRMRLPSVASEVAYVVDATLQRAGLYHQKIHVLSEMNKTIACSVDKARHELGYEPSVELREGMRRSIAWCLEHGHTI